MKALHDFTRWFFTSALLLTAVAQAEETLGTPDQSQALLSEQVQDVKAAALALNRDLRILEEELLFPASTQLVVFVSLDVGEYFRLDSVRLQINDQLVASHLYTDRQNHALSRGGVQRLYIGNLKAGEHEITAFLTGLGPENREYKRAAAVVLEKGPLPRMLELRIQDSTASMQPEFAFEEWQL